MRLALRTLFLTLLTAGSAALAARASNMPVFRHALERWPASDYELVVFHRGEMALPEQALVDRLRIAPGQSSANVAVRMVDVSGQMEEAMADLWTCQTNPQPPWVVVRAPETSADSSPVWAGRLTAAVADALLDSPARRKIVGHLLRGATAVWVLLESGEPMRDEAAVDVLSAELKRLELTLGLKESKSLVARPTEDVGMGYADQLRVSPTVDALEGVVDALDG